MAADPPYFEEAQAAGRVVVTGMLHLCFAYSLSYSCLIDHPKFELDAYIANYRGAYGFREFHRGIRQF